MPHTHKPTTDTTSSHAQKKIHKQKRRIPKDGNKLHLATLNMKTTLLLIVVLGLAAFAHASFRGTDKSCTEELHHHEHDEEHPDLCKKGCSFGGDKCVCFFNKGKGRCLTHKKFVNLNRKKEAAEEKAAYEQTDEFKEKEKKRIARENADYRKSHEEDKKLKYQLLYGNKK
jgi:hypothetical protein